MKDALGEALGSPVDQLEPVAGGDLNAAHRARLADGRTVFVKSGTGGYTTEAAGLRWLAEPEALPVPGVLAARDEAPAFLALEWIAPGRLDAAGEEALGRGLAALHAAGAPAHGWTPDGGPLRLGPLTVGSEPAASWAEVHAAQRLFPLARQARDRGALDASAARDVERVAGRVGELAGPPEPPARLHGDLWSGNVLADAEGRPHLVDPAAHGGHREVDLAMLSLFGGPGPRFRAAYEDVHPLAPGAQDRIALWQLFPLLVHAVLFGGGYGASVARAARALV